MLETEVFLPYQNQMGYMRKKPKLLPNKLLAIREFLDISQADMATQLQSDILGNSGKNYPIQAARTSDYEIGRREPNLLVLMAYARLGSIHLELIADDRFTVEELRSTLGQRWKHALRFNKQKNISPPATTRLHGITRVQTDVDTHNIVTWQGSPLVCRYCKTPICPAVCQDCNTPLYDSNRRACYLHTNNGTGACDAPQVTGLLNRAMPYDDNGTYVAYRAELITEMTRCLFSYNVLDSPGELLDNLLADVRHFADTHGLPFEEHERRSYELYLGNKAEGPRLLGEAIRLSALRTQRPSIDV